MVTGVTERARRPVGVGRDGDLLLVFDLGGSTTRAGLYDPSRRELVERISVSSDLFRRSARRTRNAGSRLVAGLDELKRSLLADGSSVAGVVLGFPGPVADGVVYAAPTLWPGETVRPFSLRDQVEEAWDGIPTIVLNDVSAAGYAYAARRDRDFCIVTVSSGVGHKVFMNGEPVAGTSGAGGEIGHVVVGHGGEGIVCDCGGRDHLGAISSGRGIRRLAQASASNDPRFPESGLGRVCGSPAAITNERIAETFRAGDPWTLEVVRSGMQPLGWMFGLIRALIGIEHFIIVGGFADALGTNLTAELARAAATSAWDLDTRWEEWIVAGELGDDAGMLGAGVAGARALA